MINTTIGQNIRALRDNAGYTQASLARFLQIDQSLISKIENGERGISTDMLERLAALFGVTVERLEKRAVSAPKLSFAFRGSKLGVNEMEAVCAINRIALNSESLRAILKEAGT